MNALAAAVVAERFQVPRETTMVPRGTTPRPQPARRPPSPVRLDCTALYTTVDQARRDRGIRSLAQVQDQAGIRGRNILTRLAAGDPPATTNLIRLLLWLGATDLGPYIARDGESEAP
jgi:hypothetical protein